MNGSAGESNGIGSQDSESVTNPSKGSISGGITCPSAGGIGVRDQFTLVT